MATKTSATTTTSGASPEAIKQITYLASTLKASRITEAAARLADQDRDAGWIREDDLAAMLDPKSLPATPPACDCASGPPGSAPSRPSRYGLIVVDEIGCLNFEQDTANLFFQLVSSRYESTPHSS